MTQQPANPVKKLGKDVRDRRLLESFKKGDRVRESERHPGEWLVSSSQYANVSYRVAYDTANRRYSCGCEWWQRTGQACRHLTRVSWEVAQIRQQVAQPGRVDRIDWITGVVSESIHDRRARVVA